MLKTVTTSIKSFVKNDNPQAQVKWSLYGRVWHEIGKPYWKWLLFGVVCTILAAGAEAFSVLLVKKIIDEGFLAANQGHLLWIGLQLIGAYSTKSLFSYIKTLVMTKAGLLGVSALRRRAFRHLVRRPMQYFNNTHTGAIMNYSIGMVGAVNNLVTGEIIALTHNVGTMLMMVAIMIWTAPQMAVVLLFLIPAILVPLTIIMRKRRIVTRNSFSADEDSITHINQSLAGVKTIQAFCNEEFEAKNMEEIEETRIKLAFKSAKLSGMQTPLLEIIISIGLCGALLIGGHFIITGAMTIGDFTAFLLALTAAYKPVKSLTSTGAGIQGGLIAAERLFTFLDSKHEIVNAEDAVELKHGQMEIQFDHVSFAYRDTDGEVLRDVSFDVKPGKTCALVGSSGSGKSTLFNLLGRFWEPSKGAVRINGTDIRKYTIESLRSNIANVSQDVFLFRGTIADNIKYGCHDATQEQLEAAAKAANAHEFITSFPEGYQTQVGERGATLSGGQKQRIAIARAILKDAPILLLDEATSALDSRSEKLIQSALIKLMQGRTTFVIAHRLATILDADMICVVKNGQIVEQGTDAELSAQNGEYKKLKDLQFKNDENKGAK